MGKLLAAASISSFRQFIPLLHRAIQRIFITADPVLETHFTIQNPVVVSSGFKGSVLVELKITVTGTGTVTVFGGDNESTDTVILDVQQAILRFLAYVGGVLQDVITIANPADGKFHLLEYSFTGTTASLSLDGGAPVTGAFNLNGSQRISVIGVRDATLSGSFYDGVIANPDLGGGNAWQLNRLTGNTEPAAGGGNDLTYVNALASTRGPFTFINGIWQGTEIWDKGDGSANGASGGFVGSNSITVTVGESFLVVYTIVNYVEGKVAPFAGSVNTDAQSNGTFTEIITAISASLGIIVRTNPTTLDVINMSVKRIIKVA